MNPAERTPSIVNRRSSPRRPPRGNVTIELRKVNLGLGRNVAVLFLDVSEGGVRLIIDQELKRGCEVEVRIASSGMPKPLKSCGTVRWVTPLDDDRFCIGVKFDNRLPYRDVATLVRP